MFRTLFAATLCVAGAGVAQAHAILEGGPARTGETADFAIRIGHGCDGQPVTGVVMEVPQGLERVAPMVKPGWTIDAATPGELRWSGGVLPDGQFDRFMFRARVTAAAGAALPVRVRQICPSAEVYWSQVAAPGVDPNSLPEPAPLLLVAYAAAQPADGSATLGPITVQGGFARAAATEGGASAAYMTIATASASDRLIAAASPAAKRVELHMHTLDAAGVARMREVEAIDVAPDKPAVLAPGGLHVMLMGLVEPLKAGEAVELTLTFEKAGSVTFSAPVVATAGQAGGHDHSRGHGAGHDHKHGG